MESIVKIIDEMQAESSKTGKEAILKTYKDNELFRKVLKFVYNTFIVTGLSTKKITKDTNIESSDFPKTIEKTMDYLRKNNTGRDADIAVIQKFISTLETDRQKEVAQQIFTKDLKVGITEKTINKIYGKGEIPSFGVMLAKSYAKKEDKVKGKFFITLKLDGNRCVAVNEKDGVKFFTRKGQPIEGMKDLASQFKELPTGRIYDGELLLVNVDGLPSDELFRATQKVVRKDGDKVGLDFHVFDSITIEEFYDGKSKKIYEQRRNTLDLMFGGFEEGQVENINLLPVLYQGIDKNMIAVLMKWAEENNYEGLMVNTANGLYVTKRTDGLMKVKKFSSADLLCIGLEEGAGRNIGRLGAILVEYKGGITKVGSGFTDAERERFWKDNDLIVGRIIETQFFEESMDEKTKQVSLRFPVFKVVRDDKGLEDINYEW